MAKDDILNILANGDNGRWQALLTDLFAGLMGEIVFGDRNTEPKQFSVYR